MQNRIRIAAVVACVAMVLFASPANAAEHWRTRAADNSPHCVSTRELDGQKLNPAVSRSGLEKRWDLTAKDRVNLTRQAGNIGSHQVYLYRWCGYTFNQRQIFVLTERTDRPGYTPKKPGDRIVVAITGWALPTGYVCGGGCTADPNDGLCGACRVTLSAAAREVVLSRR